MKKNTQFLTKIALLTLLFSFTLFSSNASVIYVATDNTSTTQDGSSWATAYNDLQVALANAISGDEIWVKQGKYYPTAGLDRNISFELVSGVALYGGFSGNETTRNARNKIDPQTYLSGDLGDDKDLSNNSYNVIYSKNVNSNTIVSGFIITDGNANPDSSTTGTQRNQNGGGWFNTGPTSSNPLIEYTSFINNHAAQQGGALFNADDASPTINNSKFEENNADVAGGAIYNSGNGSGSDASPNISNTTFILNTAFYGGAIYNSANQGTSDTEIQNCIFQENQAISSPIPGAIAGAIYNFASNSGVSDVMIANCIFDKNNSDQAAGAIYSLATAGGSSTTTILNSTFYSNNASTGGAIYLNEEGTGSGEIDIMNSIFMGNTASFNPNFHMTVNGSTTPTINISYSNIDAGDCNGIMQTAGILNCGSGIQYNVLPDFVNANGGDFRLKSTSAAIDAGNNAPVNSNNITTDLDGLIRIVQAVVDLGPYETASVLPVELLNFTARFEQDFVKLYWATASETNNDFFTIERSKDGRTFEAIEKINGAGFSEVTIGYHTLDKNPFAGLNYYRLKQTDFDGNFTYSEIRVVKVVDGKITVYPNPVAESLHISMSDFEEGDATFSISNISGKEITRGITPINAGVSIIRLDEIQSLQPGTYIVRLYTERNGAFSSKFIKTRL